MAEREASLVPLLVACACVGAAVLAIVVLSGDEDGNAIAATFAATIALPFFGLTAAAGTPLCRRESALALLGAITMVVSVLGFVAFVAMTFDDSFFFGDAWRPAAYLAIACLAAAHSSLLLADSRERDEDGLKLARAGMVVSIAVLAAMVLVEISSPGEEIGVRPFGLIAVLYLLSAAVFGLLRFSRAEDR